MQAIGIWYTPDLMQDFGLVRQEIDKAHHAGFGILIAFFRWMHINAMHPEAIAAVERSVHYAHKLGMKFALDTDPTWWQTDFTEKCPDAALRLLQRVPTRAIRGKFSCYVEVPGAAVEHTHETFDRVLAVFVEDGAGRYRFVDPADCAIGMEVGRAWQGLGPTTTHTRFNRVSGQVPDAGNRNIILYVAYKVFAYVDFAHPAFLDASRRLLEAYAHIPLDGVGWDEPGRVGGMKDCYRAGNAFLRFFRDYRGYDLVPELIHLDDPCDGRHATKVRGDYYDALTEMNVRAQADHFDHARKLFGADILLGTHQTWTPLGDIAIGYGDYFRTGAVLNPAWVDVFTTHEEDTRRFSEMLHVYCLGDSLRKEFGHRRVYSNDYFQPIQPDQIGFFTRMKMLFDVSWFYLWVGEHTEYMPNLHDRHAPQIAAAVRTLEAFSEFMGEDYRTLTDTAVLYSPVGLYAFASVNLGLPSRYQLLMRYHLVRHFLRAGRTFDFVGGRSLARAGLTEGGFCIDDRRYCRLVLPWTACISQTIRPIVEQMIRQGVQVIYVGPPCVRIAETGQDISAGFFERFRLDPFDLGEYLDFASASHPNPPDCYPHSHRAYPLSGAAATFLGHSHDGDPAVVQAADRPNAIYDSSLDALNPATYDLMPDTTGTGIRVHINNGYYRVFADRKHKNRYMLVVAAGMRTGLDAHISVDDQSLVLNGGTYAALRIDAGRINSDSIFTDAPGRVRAL